VLLQVGARIDYQLRLHGIPFRWQTEITRWEPPHAFTDIQRHGPYRKWEHTHRFTERDGGTWCEDEVHYAVPGGRLVDWLLVSGQVRGIFAYREQALRARLGGGTGKAVRG
jgi:ligand-binding SRPBCC domain-containing protein